MDITIYINELRSLFTVLAFLTFIAIVVWAWSGRRREEFDAASRMVLDDDTAVTGDRFN